MWTEQVRSMIGTGILETLYMTVVSTVFGYLFGLPMGILLCITDKAVSYTHLDVYKRQPVWRCLTDGKTEDSDHTD